MIKRTALLIISLIIGAAALAGALLCERKSDARLERPTLNYTDETILTLPYFELLAAGGENRNLPCDVVSYSLGDGFIHLTLPEDVNEKAVVTYIRDSGGIYLARRIYDFSDKVMIGPWEVVIDRHTLPTVYFESRDPAVFDIMNTRESKDVICDGNLHICVSKRDSKSKGWFREYLSTTDDISSGTSASLQGRGTSSWNVNAKRSYSLRFDKSMNLLGMGSNRNWNLIGNAFDTSLMKNIVFNSISQEAGIAYQPQMRNVNLYVDGIYQGVYTLTTKITADRKRIPLKKGDYLFKMDPPTQTQPLLYSSQTWFEDGLTYPVADLCYPEIAGEAELSEAYAILQNFINIVEDPESGELSEVCDVRSLAKYYWIEEASMNFDAWQRSTYLYYKKNDNRMHMGPVWDMDLALGSPYDKEGMTFDTPDGWRIRNAGWYTRLFQNPEFIQAVVDEYYNGGVRTALFDGIEEFKRQKEELTADGNLNFIFFGHANDMGKKSIYGDIEDYNRYCDDIIAFYTARIAWIDGQMSSQVIF